MEDCSNDQRKRAREYSESNSPESKIARVDSDSDLNSAESQLTRVNSGEYELGRVDSDNSSAESSEAREIQEDFLNILDDTDNVGERDPTMQGLDSVIKSFEEEILAPGPDPVDANLETESGDLQPNLGYLLEASDDELGLPPTGTASEEVKVEVEDLCRVGPEGVDLGGFMGFDDDIPNYESLGFGADLFVECNADEDNGFVTLDSLFDFAEPGDILWRSESLQAM